MKFHEYRCNIFIEFLMNLDVILHGWLDILAIKLQALHDHIT